MNAKDMMWYGVSIDDDYDRIEYSSPNLDYVKKQIDRHIRLDKKHGRYHKYTIVTLGMIDRY